MFAPGDSVGHFARAANIDFSPDLEAYGHENAWWLAEFCRLAYRIDDQLNKPVELSADIDSALRSTGFQIDRILFDLPTSSRAVVFTRKQESEVGANPITLIVFCGTNAINDWKMNIQTLQDSFVGGARIHKGFKQCFESLAAEILQLTLSEGVTILAGHSLGAALATLATVVLDQREIPIRACYSFGSPRIGNREFVELLAGLPIYRLVNNCDVVTAVPLSLKFREYLHPDDAIFFGRDGRLIQGMCDKEIQERQLSYLPQLKKYAELSSFLDRTKALSTELPEYLADHAITNYRYKIATQLARVIERSP